MTAKKAEMNGRKLVSRRPSRNEREKNLHAADQAIEANKRLGVMWTLSN